MLTEGKIRNDTELWNYFGRGFMSPAAVFHGIFSCVALHFVVPLSI